MSNKFLIFKYAFNYLVLSLIFKFSHYLIGVNIDSLNKYFLVFIPLAFLVVKILFYNDLEKNKLMRKPILGPIIIIFTIINLVCQMPIFYTIMIIVFLILIKNDKSKLEEITNKNIKEYFESQKSKK